MVNLLYWPLIAAGLYTGFYDYPLWTILALGAGSAIAYFIVKPGTLQIGLRERGLVYLLVMVAGSSAVMSIFFGVGWLIGRAAS
jgi:hypothetical protein